MRWALVKVCVAVTTMVVVAFAVPLGLAMAVNRTFEELAASPSYRARAAAGAAPSDDDQLLALERDLGSFIGAAARRRATGV